jgi:SAM-dependent methyltransferase
VPSPQADLKINLDDVRSYWNAHIHDFEISSHAPGTPGFFKELDAYHFEKLHHLPRLVDFAAYRGQKVLDVGCGVGVDLARFVRHGAIGFGIDISERALDLAKRHFEIEGLEADLRMGSGEAMPYDDATFDFVFAHGVVQYTVQPERLVAECRRVLKPGGRALFQVYNRISWLNLLSWVLRTPLEHEDAPVLLKYTIKEFQELLHGFSSVEIVTERFPVRSRLHRGVKGALYNTFFVGAFNALPRSATRRFGWHLLGFCQK